MQPEFYMKLKSLTKVEGDHQRANPVKFGEILQSGLGDVIYVSMDVKGSQKLTLSMLCSGLLLEILHECSCIMEFIKWVEKKR